MIARFQVHPAVSDVDLDEALTYYRELDTGLPQRMTDDFVDRLGAIRSQPGIGRPLFEDYRRIVLRHSGVASEHSKECI